MNNNILNNAQETNELRASFEKECNVIDQKVEYGESFFGPRWLIATSLTEEEIKSKYKSILHKYSPYMLISPAIGKVFTDFRRSDEKHEKQLKRNQVMSFEEGITDLVYSEVSQDDYGTQMEQKDMSDERVRIILEALKLCNNVEASRMYKYCFDKKSIQEIADEENVCRTSVNKSIISCRKKLADILAPIGLMKVIVSDGMVKEIRI